MSLSRALARPLLASTFLVGASEVLRRPAAAAERAEPVIGALQRLGVPLAQSPETLVRVNAGVQLVGAAGLVTGTVPRLSAAVLAASLIPTTLAGHAFWRESDRAVRRQQRIQFAKNASVLGGLLIASLDTEGRPGRAWLARAAARRLSREAEHLATTARLESRIAGLEAAGAGDVLAGTLTSVATGLAGRAHEAGRTAGAWGEQVHAESAQRLVDQVGDRAGAWGTRARKQAGVEAKRARRSVRRARKRIDAWSTAAQETAHQLGDTVGERVDALR